MTFRTELERVDFNNFENSGEVIEIIDKINKEDNVNLIIFI